MSVEYPTLIYTGTGSEAIAQGHALTDEQIVEVEDAVLGPLPPDYERIVTEVHFRFVPRIKWCANLDGFGCDQEGDWHGHWTEVRPKPGAEFTLIRHRHVSPKKGQDQ